MIETTHRGHRITFSENDDKWRCWDIDFEHVQLSKVRAKIDKTYLAMRKDAAFNVLVLSGYGGRHEVAEGRALDYSSKQERGGSYFDHDSKRPLTTRHYLGVMVEGGGKKKHEVTSLALPTPEVYAALDRLKELDAAVKVAEKAAAEAFLAIPRITPDDWAALARAAETQIEES